jgi:hypothetical protein
MVKERGQRDKQCSTKQNTKPNNMNPTNNPG